MTLKRNTIIIPTSAQQRVAYLVNVCLLDLFNNKIGNRWWHFDKSFDLLL